jgi:hypothetical protein
MFLVRKKYPMDLHKESVSKNLLRKLVNANFRETKRTSGTENFGLCNFESAFAIGIIYVDSMFASSFARRPAKPKILEQLRVRK